MEGFLLLVFQQVKKRFKRHGTEIAHAMLSYGNRSGLFLAAAYDEKEGYLLQLAFSDLFADGFTTIIGDRSVTAPLQLLCNSGGICFYRFVDGENGHLNGGEPEGECAAEVFYKYAEKAFG